VLVDLIFKALADETRRLLLDRLRERNGQTLTELESGTGMTRFGVMKHLNQLEAAGLVVTRKEGRFKFHHLNAAPIQQVVDRWIEPLTQRPMARALLDLKADIEGAADMASDKPDFVLETYIRTTPEKLWEALTNGEMTRRYYIANAALTGEIRPGGAYAYMTADGKPMLTGEIIAADPPRRLEMTFLPGWTPGARPSRNVYEIERAGDAVKLTILHFDIPRENAGVRQGWAKVAASLKSLLETGEALTVA
jgi:uncharacterized protein YndB with AHSA1/START domain/DNA-binding transcriptional ArsR family regulator